MTRIDWPVPEHPSWRTRLLVSGAWVLFLALLAMAGR